MTKTDGESGAIQGGLVGARVGQEIPANFYRAIAEILAYVYRLMGTQMK